jgi:hypothetical protein
VIRRLLNGEATKESMRIDTSAASSASSRDLMTRGGVVPSGTQLRAQYKKRTYTAEISNGSVIWEGKAYTSLSDAAVAVIQSTGSKRATEDGWRFWQYHDKTDNEWRLLDHLRTDARS